ncbi:hypothetical protein, unlikely [Trypanosoma brucei gambiense DAL972]|uniref:Uncharacterized protein n=1 Tax=Trypanosoma brucei gambiense (strain MHOM/CI/86/DAL972) TaxID=679716 RepID=D0A3F2_TRYB9|nr:hypothetical protein, unlikely [Trypanosoma brucei gambiense DAL972]CBH15796.1 hypothetical protein, unlikely [Trypanosoma brucei gambiense DAL972]|eukprot:XP_011778060.1 hypothetical protein, unlikely [Trypanosoma brucei gambiense DAL972]
MFGNSNIEGGWKAQKQKNGRNNTNGNYYPPSVIVSFFFIPSASRWKDRKKGGESSEPLFERNLTSSTCRISINICFAYFSPYSSAPPCSVRMFAVGDNSISCLPACFC